MSDFSIYFNEGWKHITDLNGYDHMLFIIALALSFTYDNWRRLAVLITAFTIGHSIALALSVLDIVRIKPAFIETLIPITILITAIQHLVFPQQVNKSKQLPYLYAITTAFGLIHGMGFSNYLRMLLGSSDDLFSSLFAFNIGLEVGQLLILAIFLLIEIVILRYKVLKWSILRTSLASIIAVMSLYLIFA